MQKDFLPIQTLDLNSERKLSFNLFVNLPLNNKFILYRKAGELLEASKIEKFSEGNLSTFFIRKEDYAIFVKYVAERINELVGKPDSPNTLKMMSAAAKSLLSSTFESNDPATSAALMSNLKDITGTIIENSLEKTGPPRLKKIFNRLYQLSDKGTDFQKHPVNVTSIAVLLTFGIGYSNQKIISDMAMAALLHDVGLSALPRRLISLAHHYEDLKEEEQELLASHPKLSIEIIEKKEIPVSVLAKNIILQHHESYSGKGYPLRLRGYHLNELAQVLKIADEIDQLFNEFFFNSFDFKQRLHEKFKSWNQDRTIDPKLLVRINSLMPF